MELISPADDVAGRSSEIRVETVSPRLGLGVTLAAYLDLTKPRITFLIVLSALAGFALGSSSPINWVLLFHTVFGIGLLCSGIGALNQYWERDLDALMLRTQRRPLPSGKLNARQALWFGVALALLAANLALLVGGPGALAVDGWIARHGKFAIHKREPTVTGRAA